MKTHFKKINKKSAIIFTCEHASPKIPKEYKNLDISEKHLANCKDLYDPFAKDLFSLLVNYFNSSYIYSDQSRLVIDMNRNINASNKNQNTYHSALIKKQILVEENGKEFFVDLPFNVGKIESGNFSEYEKYLYEKVCLPYQEDIKKIILHLQKKFEKIYVISVHTMFPKYNGPKRKIEIDLIGDEGNEWFKNILKSFRKENNNLNIKYKLGINKPWGFKDADNGAFHEIMFMQNVEVMALEIRNDILANKKGLKNIFDICRKSIEQNIV